MQRKRRNQQTSGWPGHLGCALDPEDQRHTSAHRGGDEPQPSTSPRSHRHEPERLPPDQTVTSQWRITRRGVTNQHRAVSKHSWSPVSVAVAEEGASMASVEQPPNAPAWLAAVTAEDRPDLWELVNTQHLFDGLWPEYNHHGNHAGRYFGGHRCPPMPISKCSSSTNGGVGSSRRGGPSRSAGMERSTIFLRASMQWGSRAITESVPPSALSALAAEVDPSYQGSGLSARLIKTMRGSPTAMDSTRSWRRCDQVGRIAIRSPPLSAMPGGDAKRRPRLRPVVTNARTVGWEGPPPRATVPPDHRTRGRLGALDWLVAPRVWEVRLCGRTGPAGGVRRYRHLFRAQRLDDPRRVRVGGARVMQGSVVGAPVSAVWCVDVSPVTWWADHGLIEPGSPSRILLGRHLGRVHFKVIEAWIVNRPLPSQYRARGPLRPDPASGRSPLSPRLPCGSAIQNRFNRTANADEIRRQQRAAASPTRSRIPKGVE